MVNPESQKTRTLFVAMAGLLLPLLVSAAIPGPPTNVCVDNVCNGTATPAPTGSIKWHPGHYVLLDKVGWSTSTQSMHFSQMDALATNTVVKGFEITLSWTDLEPTRDNYAPGRAIIQAYLDKASSLAVPKRIMINIREREFGTPGGQWPNSIPRYLETSEFSGGAAIAAVGSGYALTGIAKSWESAVMDRMIALTKHYATHFDNHKYLEMFGWEGESAVLEQGNSGYNAGTYINQWKRMLTLGRPAWKKTQYRYWPNYTGSQSMESEFAALAASKAVSMGGPDTWVRNGNAWSDLVHIGKVWNGTAFVDGGVDYRGKTPWLAEVQSTAYQGSHGFPSGGVSFQQVYDFAFNTMQMSYMVWYRNEWAGNSSQMWPANLTFINAHPTVARTACPTTFASCDTG